MKCTIRPGLIFLLFLLGTTVLMAQPENRQETLSRKIGIMKKGREARIAAFLSHTSNRNRSTPPEFLLIDVTPGGIPIYRMPLNANARITTGVDKLQSGQLGVNLQGKGMTVGIWDAGKVTEHVEYAGRIIPHEDTTAHPHSLHVAGTILASGVNPAAKGMAPLAIGSTWVYDNDYEEMLSQISPDQSGLVISNHSYGSTTGWYRSAGVWHWTGDPVISNKEDYRFGLYGEESRIIDEIANYAPYYTIVWAAGNDRSDAGNGTFPADGNQGTGYDCLIQDAVAKNAIVVGAIDEVLSYTDPSSVQMAFFSSWGPTDDGRIKPDLVADGYNMFSSVVAPNSYGFTGGTSQSTASVTGSLVLLQELYKKLHGNQVMRSSMLKALAIHTAKESGSDPGPDYRFGWGLLDVEHAAKTLLNEGTNVLVEELTLKNNQTIMIPLQPVPNKKITATIAWTEAAGVPPAASLDPTIPMLINDLDIKITDLDGNNILPWILDPANPSAAAATGDNIRDNVEKIEFALPEDRPYQVVISHKGQLINDQVFSLIITHDSKLETGRTFYWIGGAGNWTDNSHWSLTSGGSASLELPGATDKIVVDDNSFPGGVEVIITLDANASCQSLTWLSDKPGALSLNDKTLTISKGLTLASDYFRTITEGTFEFNGSGEINFQDGQLTDDLLLFTGGDWTVYGELSAGTINVTAGSLTIANPKLSVQQLIASEATSIDVTDCEISSLIISSLENVTFQSEGARIKVDGSTLLNFEGINFGGTIEITEGSKLGLFGQSKLDSVVVSGELNIAAPNHINYLEATSGALILLEFGKTQNVSSLSLTGAEGAPVTIQSTIHENATLSVNSHEKLCFDYLVVTSVDLQGNAIVNAGLNSIITDSDGWLSVSCADVLFPEFDVEYTCEHGLTMFTDKSTGPITNWSWSFDDAGSSDNASEEENPNHQFSSTGLFDVTLTVSNENHEQQYTRQIEIIPNAQSSNSIVVSNGVLTSKNTATSYQWYLNNELIEGAINKDYVFDVSGSYTLITTKDGCNYLTDPFLISGVERSAEKPFKFSPNPADQLLNIKFSRNQKPHVISFYNSIGQKILQKEINENETTLDVRNFTNGIYILDSDGHKSKLIISH